MTKPEGATLKEVYKNASQKTTTFRASDFLSNDEQRQLRRANVIGKKQHRRFDAVDALVAEIIARFGYETYKAWDSGEISDEKMSRLIAAERAREAQNRLPLEALMFNLISSCIRIEKGTRRPSGVKRARELIKSEGKIASGN